MRTLSTKQQWLIAGGLALVMAVTRSPQLGTPELLHAGSWAIFFAAGAYLSAALALPALLVLAFALDAAAVGWGGISAYCFTPAYAMLLPAYGALWGAGRWYAGRHRDDLSTLAPLAGSVLVGAVVCELLSSGGFYWFSGRFADPTLAEFAVREVRYFPTYLGNMVAWVSVFAVLHAAIVAIRGGRHAARGTAG